LRCTVWTPPFFITGSAFAFIADSDFVDFFIVGNFTSGQMLDGAPASASVFRPEPNAEKSCTVSAPADFCSDGRALASFSDGMLSRALCATTIAPRIRSVPVMDRIFIGRSCQPPVKVRFLTATFAKKNPRRMVSLLGFLAKAAGTYNCPV
jgi:hypothetical protein